MKIRDLLAAESIELNGKVTGKKETLDDLEDGDTIVWTYTCNGLGADVGGGMG